MFLPPNERTIVPPVDGWEDKTYYVVAVSMSRTNLVHKSIFYSGFLSDKNNPANYNAVWGDESNIPINKVHYLKVIRKIDMSDENTDQTIKG